MKKRYIGFAASIIFLVALGLGCSGGGGKGVDEPALTGNDLLDEGPAVSNIDEPSAESETASTEKLKNNPPVANAGNDQAGAKGMTIKLDGSNSSDPEGGALNFEWSFVKIPQGGDAQLSNPKDSKTSFVIPSTVSSVPDAYTIKLVVTDAEGLDSSDEINVSVNNIAPVIKEIVYKWDSGGVAQSAPVEHVDVEADTTATLKGEADDVDKDNLSYSWSAYSESETYIAHVISGADKDEVKISVPNMIGAFGTVELTVKDPYISVKKIVTVQGWKGMTLAGTNVPPRPRGMFVKPAASTCQENGTIECPYSSIDKAISKNDKATIYLLAGDYTLSGPPNPFGFSLIGGYEINNGKWRRPGFGYKKDNERLFSHIDINNPERSLITIDRTRSSFDQVDISGLSIESACSLDPVLNNGVIKLIDLYKNPARIMFNKFNTHFDGSRNGNISCHVVSIAESMHSEISHNSFTHDVIVPTLLENQFIRVYNQIDGETLINGNHIEYNKVIGSAIYVNGGYGARIFQNKIEDPSAMASVPAIFTNAIEVQNVGKSLIHSNKILPNPQRIQTTGITVRSVLSPSKTLIYSNLITLGPDEQGSHGIKLSELTDAKVYNNTLVAAYDENKNSKDILLECTDSIPSLYVTNNIFYMGYGGPLDEKIGFYLNNINNNCKLASMRNNSFFRFGDIKNIANSAYAKDSAGSDVRVLLEILKIENNLIDIDPQFIDSDKEYHLKDSSPLINSGDESQYDARWAGVDFDLDGKIRPLPDGSTGKNYDIGADEVK